MALIRGFRVQAVTQTESVLQLFPLSTGATRTALEIERFIGRLNEPIEITPVLTGDSRFRILPLLTASVCIL